MPAATDEVRFHFPIFKFDTTDNGDLIVYGKCTDGTVDADHQIVDPKWSGKALEDWLATGGNMRVQHSPFLYPAGKGLALEIDKDGDGGHWLKALVAQETPAYGLVKKGILQDFSVGILDPKLSFRSPLAPEGTIIGGRIGEVSLVDRGSNKNSRFTIAKASSAGDPELVYRMYFEGSPADMARMLTKKKKRIVDSGGTDRTDTPKDQFAGPHNTFPVENRSDVSDAASLAHHADNPSAVRSNIRSIATGELGMKPEDLPPSLKDGGTCPMCHGTGKVDGEECNKCMGKGLVPDVAKGPFPGAAPPFTSGGKPGKSKKKGGKNKPFPGAAPPFTGKGDAADDYPGAKGMDESSTEDYDADNDAAEDEDADDKPSKSNKSYAGLLPDQPKQGRSVKKGRPKRGRRDPAAAGRAKSKDMDPAPLPAGQVDSDVYYQGQPGSARSATKAVGTSPSSAPYSVVVLHAAVCPASKRKALKSLGYNSVKEAIPFREWQSTAMDAISKGLNDLADYYLGLIRVGESVMSFDESVFSTARKVYGNLYGSTMQVGSAPAMHPAVAPSMFQGGYLSSGRPAQSAQGHRPDGLPNAVSHHVSAGDFTRGALSAGHPPMSAGGREASFDSAVMGQAVTAMQRFHQHVDALWPDLCQANISQRDYTQGDGHTAISASQMPSIPTAPGESGLTSQNYKKSAPITKAVAKRISRLEKANRRMQAELDAFGAQPDPLRSAFRGIPMVDGPVDRFGHADKALGSSPVGDDEAGEYIGFLQNLSQSSNFALREGARKMLKGLLTADKEG